jgi:hypothetical protein
VKERICIPALAALAMAAPALAHAEVTDHMFSGYVDLGAGPGSGQWSGSYFDTYDWHETTFHGAAKAAITLTPSFVTQFDAWMVNLDGSDTSSGDYNMTQMGVAGHAAWMPTANTLLGLMASVGQDSYPDSPMHTVAVEFAYWGERTRFYAQAGRVIGGGMSEGVDTNYIEGVFTYYHTPNVALTGILGYDHEVSADGGYANDELDWGARLEFKKDTLPFSLYVSYQGFRLTGGYDPSSTYQAIGHRVLGGIRIPFGSGSLQDLDRTAGLGDLNPIYGDIPH